MKASRASVLLIGLLTLGLPASGAAQVSLGGYNLEGEIEAGPRFFLVEPSKSRKAKFEEYRDMTEGLVLDHLYLRLSRPDESYSAELYGSKWGYEDQNFGLSAGRLGLWEFRFEWDQTPHVYSTTARMLAKETDRGVFRLDTPRPSPLTLYNAAPRLDEISVRWDTAKMSLVVAATPNLDITAEYKRIRKDGDKPFGMAFGSPGNNFMEILEPVEQTIHDFRVKGSWARDWYQIQFGYGLSIFENDVSRVIADNPCFANAGACGAGDGTGAPASGQTSLPPDNMAHSFNLAAGVNLPMRTRVTGNFNYSLRLQNDAFLPHTINPVLAANPDLVLPRKSLDGNVQTVLFNLMATSRPWTPVTLSAKYRYYEMFDVSPVLHFDGVVVNDRSLSPSRRAGRWDFSKQNADIDARWQILPPVAVTTGVGWEHWDRNEHREVPESDEFFGKVAVDVTPTDWVLVRGTYRPSFRRISNYNTGAHANHTVDEDAAAAAAGQSRLLRKFDEGERNEQRFDLLVQLSLFDTLSISPTASYRYDDYIQSRLGLQEETSWSAGIDLTWSPVERVAFSAGYVREQIDRTMRSRSRAVVGTTTFDFKDFDWVSDTADSIDTVYAGLKMTLIPRVLDWSSGVNFATATGRLDTRNPVTPASGTAAQRLTATAQRFPATEDNLIRVDAALRYYFDKGWSATLGYAFESFQKNDWRTDRLVPFMPGVTSIWLGNDERNYSAHIIGATLAYRFK
jgi:MtrB/PioB family decaheme-associated outer membrane protein